MGKLRQTQLWRRSVLWKMIISLEWVFAVRDRIKMAEAGRDKLGVGSPLLLFLTHSGSLSSLVRLTLAHSESVSLTLALSPALWLIGWQGPCLDHCVVATLYSVLGQRQSKMSIRYKICSIKAIFLGLEFHTQIWQWVRTIQINIYIWMCELASLFEIMNRAPYHKLLKFPHVYFVFTNFTFMGLKVDQFQKFAHFV